MPLTVPSIVTWTNDLLKTRLLAELRDYDSFGHGEVYIRIYYKIIQVSNYNSYVPVDIFVKPVVFPTIKVIENVPNTPSDVELEDSDVKI